MLNNLIYIIGPILAGLLTWALQKVYTLITEKISISKEITNVRANSMDAKYASERTEERVLVLSNDFKELNAAIKKLDQRVSVREERSKLTEKAIEALIIDYKQRKKK